jgi:hypothetical protein
VRPPHPPPPPLSPFPRPSDFCADTVPRFTETVVKPFLDADYKHLVVAERLQEPFFKLAGVANATLSGLVSSLCDPSLHKMARSTWSAVTAVGDSSAYVGEMVRALRRAFSVVRRRLDETPFRSFCDRFVRAFVPRYVESVYRCKKIGEMGAQQLLLDVSAVKAALLVLPLSKPASDRVLAAIAAGTADKGAGMEEEEGGAGGGGGGDGEPPAAPPAVYVKYVNQNLPRMEMMLKVVATPKDRFAVTMKALWPEAKLVDVQNLMNLKDMNKKEQDDVLRVLGHVRPTGGLGAALGVGGWAGGGGGAGGGATAAASAGAPLTPVATAAAGAGQPAAAAAAAPTGGSGAVAVAAGGASSAAPQLPQKAGGAGGGISLGGIGKLFGAGGKK